MNSWCKIASEVSAIKEFSKEEMLPRIRCHYLDCVFLDGKYCSAAAIELDPDTGCKTYQPGDDIDLEDWDVNEDLDEWDDIEEDSEEDLWIDEKEEVLIDLDLDEDDEDF